MRPNILVNPNGSIAIANVEINEDAIGVLGLRVCTMLGSIIVTVN